MDRTPPDAKSADKPQDPSRRLHNPHDAWFKAILEDPRRAGDVLRTFLPTGLVSQFSDAPPDRVSAEFLNHNLHRRVGDTVFRQQLKSGLSHSPLHVIVEHQSTVDPLMAIRTLVYKSLLMERLTSRMAKEAPQAAH